MVVPEFLSIQTLILAIVGVIVLRLVVRLARRGLIPSILTDRPRIIDGDTILVRGKRIRLAGIDAPEIGQRLGGRVLGRSAGAAAAAELYAIVGRQRVTVRPVKTDPYGRLVAQVRIGELDVGAEMIRRGFAVAYATGNRRYRGLEHQARAEGRGLWAHGFERPADFRRRQRSRLFPTWRC